MSKQIFQSLKDLPTSLFESQYEYKFICSYPSNVTLQGHCVVKLIDGNEIILLSFGGYYKHTLMMKYTSVWNKSKKLKKLNNYNQWIPFTDKYNNIIYFGKDKDDYKGMRAIIGGSNNNLLFITYKKNINVFDLNKSQLIKQDILPINNEIYYHCLISKLENEEKNYKMILFGFMTGLSIEYNENNNDFQFNQLYICNDIISFHKYAYVYINDVILFFGGYSKKDGKDIISKLVHKYSIRENKWTTFSNTLPSQLQDCIAILSKDKKDIHIIGGKNKNHIVSTHMKTKVSEWLNEEEIKKGIELEIEEKNKNENENENIKKKEDKKNWTKWWKEKNEKDKEEIISKFEQLSINNFEMWLLHQSKWKHELNNENIYAIYAAIESYIDYHLINVLFEKNKKWIKWLNQKEQKDKTKIIENFGIMQNEQFALWLLNKCKWKNEITKDDIDSIRFSIDIYSNFITTNQDNKEEEWIAYIIIDERKKLIKMKELTFEELLRQSYNCLELKHFQKMRNEFFKMQLVDMKNNIIESDEFVKKEFENNEPTFEIIWTLLQPITTGRTKIIKNALVIMIAISEYIDQNAWVNLDSVKDNDINNFKSIFSQELNYTFICNKKSKMNKEDVYEFLTDLVAKHKLHKNKKIMMDDGKSISIDEIRALFDCNQMESLKDYPKIFIIDVCRGNNIPEAKNNIKTKGKRQEIQNNFHNDNGFLMIWSTTKGYQVSDLSLFSESMKNTIISKYKIGYSLNQMLRDIRNDIKRQGSGEWYCVESQDTVDYDIIFQQRNK
ncbi:hypothetical protein RFI_21820 [Reticulomyxa filosa]|uniref:Caspase family p20 domain-containing protein n=1 Tax=Reticulomyxa filosa TaxID=46433 RepID=X6MNG4_RETFI|nr:hypothetical protein RFI_21820 [Reticulomyxa filosa]|eukprot:ETO15543.1 hypothetical protein RFI_21820 [Reticulomyxa filosa]